MPLRVIETYGPKKITSVITLGSLYVTIALTSLLLTYDIINETLIRPRFWIACSVIIYLLIVRHLLRKDKINTANWLIIILYEALAASVLITWGLSSAVGIVSACFAMVLPGVLMTPRYTLPVALMTFGVLLLTYVVHSTGLLKATPYIPAPESHILDVLAYATIIAVFALVSWVSARQSSLSIAAALQTEEALKEQKHQLAVELEEQSARLRHAQLQQIQQLHRFAAIGQSATATLHELSNHLSVLNLDIDDIKQQYTRSQAISNAEEGISYINTMVRKTRAQLNAQNQTRPFNVVNSLRQVLKDFQAKFEQHQVTLTKSVSKSASSFRVFGDPINLIQCISILLNNALDACSDIPYAHVSIALATVKNTLTITITDNGPGVDPLLREGLFEPLESTKPSGLGVGLYIASHLIKSQFGGDIILLDTAHGASFQIILPRYVKR